ncbi:nucleoside triphosphate pyrophosphohydrolase [Gilvimarinus agarilyticus]|uniref:nucleoside triphosphate pyrophosphohydrolase n=1 Tax=unclassified Gilvimarinus TaxID=2642066 RepID=UPI001C08B296|nr:MULTISPECIES: nucleoside triphosphate pyrophosphohydrolase [unclassified Gilvimarinus]MBU2886133.1 nucleoside triphosphate pyrophosphohydrolase [Gilvimarinus agarilyticus]MDO6570843.1 nucleoside triphosphate pyrophosphohydrolase [Gilvimarinus sp. 2_MG-2023]MDO6747011.1 nucleoside triphosphate pyrophosphohydrolase [Gilvimarinus sp. 1_MG-2023]
MSSTTYTLNDLIYLMQRLRDPVDGCPWDVKQSYQTIVPSTIEEAYEVADAIERGDLDHLKEELGDLLFQVIFYSQLGAEEHRFDFHQVVDTLVAKLVRRHPHVFPDESLRERYGDRPAEEAEIKQRWEDIKQEEREAKGVRGTLDDVPLNLPALTRAAKLQKRAARTGFDWEDVQGPIAKVREELQEVEQALAAGNMQAVEEEIGDLLFAVVNISRTLKQDPEGTLRRANQKFERRFRYIEANASESLASMTLPEMDRLWEQAKSQGL